MPRCKQDLISYYQAASGHYFRSMHVVEAIRKLSRNHDFNGGHLLINAGHNVDRAFLLDAGRYFGASLLQFLAHSYLDGGGYLTWANVTRYYSRYFAVVAFTRLLGYATMWLTEFEKSKKNGQNQFWVVRANGNDHSYIIGRKPDLHKIGKENPDLLPYKIPPGFGSHKTTWSLLANICTSWDEDELSREAQFLTPKDSAVFPDL